MKKFACLILFFIFKFSQPYLIIPTIQAQEDIPKQELLSDIKIMETVLDQMISPEQEQIHFWGANAKGYYLKNYGLIFNVNCSFNRGMMAINLEKRLKIKENNFVIVGKEEGKELNQDSQKEREQLKKSLVKFLGSWTSALSDLSPDEKVTVIVDFNGFIPGFTNDFDFSIHQLIASVAIRDITNYRRGITGDDDFIKKISFDEVKTADEDISILSNVIQTSLEHPDRSFAYGLAGDVKGIYFKGYGVIFFTNVTFGSKEFTIYSNMFDKAKQEYALTVKDQAERSEQGEKNVRKLEQKLIQLVSNYGHTLRTLQPNEWLEIAVNFKGIPVRDKYSKTILKVQKKIIDDFSRDRIKYDQFKNMVRVIYY